MRKSQYEKESAAAKTAEFSIKRAKNHLKRAYVFTIIYKRVFAYKYNLSHLGEPRCLAISGV